MLFIVYRDAGCRDCVKGVLKERFKEVDFIVESYRGLKWLGTTFAGCKEEHEFDSYSVDCERERLEGMLSSAEDALGEVVVKCGCVVLAAITNVPGTLPWGPLLVESIDEESIVYALWVRKGDLNPDEWSLLKLLLFKTCIASDTLEKLLLLLDIPFIPSAEVLFEELELPGNACNIVVGATGYLVLARRRSLP